MRRVALLVALCCAAPAAAAPRDFGFTWDSHTLGKGKAEPWLWISPSSGRRDVYTRVDFRAGAMLGLSDDVETALLFDAYFQHEGRYALPSASGRITSLWRHRFLDAEGPLGVAGQVEVSLGLDDAFAAARIAVERHLGGVRLAGNLAVEKTIFFKGQVGPDLRTEQSAALGYGLGNGLTVSAEYLSRQALLGVDFVAGAFYVGFGVTWKLGWGWLAFTVLPQVAAVKTKEDVGDGERLELRHHERFLFRLAVGLDAR